MSILKMLRLGTRSSRPARFTLLYAPTEESPVTVGHLGFDGKVWTFAYDDEFKGRPDLRPIEGMDELSRTYRSPVLFPFFAVRVPDIDREDIKRMLASKHLSDPGEADLLRLFGRRVVSSPAFELLPA